MAHLELERIKHLPAFRKISIGTWRTAYDPSVYGTMEIEMDAAMDYLRRYREATGVRLTVSHMMARVMAAALERIPDANALMRGSRIYRRKRISIFFQVAMTDEGDEGKVDLSGTVLHDVDKMSLAEIVTTFDDKVDKVRKRTDETLEKTRRSFMRMPAWAMHRLLRFTSFLLYTLNWKAPGLPRDAFGSLMITNIGTLGLDVAYAPLVPFSRVPILIAMGAVKAVPIVRDGQVVVGQTMKVSATFDHRFIDGFHAAVMSKVVHQWFEHPDAHFGPIPGGRERAAAGHRPGLSPAPPTPSPSS
ncbi:MAG: 2-oxo acid dehydrogenase [Deltaproteobacteria bacterium HGW-Deltaproteobacteria-14]|nr:MAG: 2-oxo acid dehydrogenase [Deltaproteobacteria bacterium HGW-Deltaproteobacteria-14]